VGSRGGEPRPFARQTNPLHHRLWVGHSVEEDDVERFRIARPAGGVDVLLQLCRWHWPLPSNWLKRRRRARAEKLPWNLLGAGVILTPWQRDRYQEVLEGCGDPSEIEAKSRAIAPLSGLSRESDCQTATSTRVIVDRQLTASDKEIEGFRFKDKFGAGGDVTVTGCLEVDASA
jgi:hypothetical protein